MTDKTLTYQDVREIIKLVEEADKFGEFRLRYNDIEISLSKHAPLSDVATRRSVQPRSRACRCARGTSAASGDQCSRGSIEHGGGKRRQCPRNGPPIS